MRLLGFMTLCLLAMTVFRLGYDSRNDIVSFVSNQIDVLDDPELGAQPEPVTTIPAEISMREAATLTALIGLPSLTNVHFDLPRSASAVSGEIVLDVSGAVAENVDAVLSVSVNGVQRGAELLARGPLERSFILPLNARDLASETLSIALATEEAAARSPSGAVVKILPSSRMTLQLTEAVTDPLDKLLLAGVPARFSWPELTAADQTAVLATAFEVTQRQTDVLFLPEPEVDTARILSTDEIKQLATSLPARPEVEPIEPVAPVDTADLANALGQDRTQYFGPSAKWHMSFDADTLSGDPQAVELSLKYATAQTRNTPWLMAVFLNDRFLQGRLIEGKEGELQAQVTLPTAVLASENVLTVTFRNSSTSPDELANEPPSVAEIATAQLLIENPVPPAPEMDVTDLLGNGALLQLPNALTLFEGQVALDTLKALASLGVDLRLSEQPDANASLADIAAVNTNELDAFLAARDTKDEEQLWIAYQSGDDAQTLVTQPLTASSTMVADTLPKSVLIISGASQEDNS